MPLAPIISDQIPIRRSSAEEIRDQYDFLSGQPFLKDLLEAMPQMAVLLNDNRQIVLANSAFTGSLEMNALDQVLGLRPGEATGCPNSLIHEQGCGCAPACASCGAARAIVTALGGRTATCQCQLEPDDRLDPLDLLVKATPLDLAGRRFVVCALTDVSREAAYRILERTFFHDILNTAGGVQGLAGLVVDAEDMEEVQEYAPLLANQADQLVEAIQSQRDLVAADRGELEVKAQPVGSLTLVQAALDLYRNHQVAQGRTIARDPASERMILTTGKVLVQRVLGNMLKNALEASQPGDTVTIGCSESAGRARFWVHNPAVMPAPVQQKVFKRSFSTKGAGRGLGTYSMKLMGQKYLGGKVGFSSQPGQGTTFWIELPLKPADPADRPPT